MRTMHPFRSLFFLLQCVSAGLAAAFVLLVFDPQLFRPPAPAAASAARASVRSLHQLNMAPTSYAAAVALAAPAVVNIHSSRIIPSQQDTLLNDPLFKRQADEAIEAPARRVVTNLGSGVIVSSDGLVLTNNHVIRGADAIRVLMRDGREIDAQVVGTDADTDLAVLRIGLTALPTIVLSDVSSPQVGDVVLAIGNPFGVGQTVTMGIVSATGRSRLGINTFEDFIQTDAAINPGNSGGALVSSAGELVGINTAIFSQSGGSDGIGFAIPARLAKDVMQQVLSRGYVARGWLGIQVESPAPSVTHFDLLPTSEGVIVSGVIPGAPGAQAGILPGDIITHVASTKVDNTYDAVNAIANVLPGQEVELTIVRGSATHLLKAIVTQRPQQEVAS